MVVGGQFGVARAGVGWQGGSVGRVLDLGTRELFNIEWQELPKPQKRLRRADVAPSR
jgi:hypothetical protein